ncbi:MAG: hypothetical protein ABIH72_02825 [archaeon]
MNLEKKIVIAAITLATAFGFSKSAEAQGPFIAPMPGGIRAGIRPGTECQMQYNQHPPYGSHINLRCYNNSQPVFNHHQPIPNPRAIGAAGMAANIGMGHFSQIELSRQHCQEAGRLQALQNRNSSYARPGMPVIAPNYTPEIRRNQELCNKYYQQSQFRP